MSVLSVLWNRLLPKKPVNPSLVTLKSFLPLQTNVALALHYYSHYLSENCLVLQGVKSRDGTKGLICASSLAIDISGLNGPKLTLKQSCLCPLRHRCSQSNHNLTPAWPPSGPGVQLQGKRDLQYGLLVLTQRSRTWVTNKMKLHSFHGKFAIKRNDSVLYSYT